jgi:hypothetical protein
MSMAERARPVGALAEIGLCGRSILVDLAHRLVRRRKRKREQVLSDYDRGEWAQQLEARNWERAGSLEAYAEKSWIDRDLTCLVDGRLWRMPVADYYRLRHRMIAGILRRFAGDADELVEVGSGTGTNLFALAADKTWPQLRGLELSPTGRDVARRVAERFGAEDRVSFDEIDLLDAASPGFRLLEGKTVFSYLCLEQLPDDTEKVMRHLYAAKVKRVIHFETTFELLSPRSLRDLASMSYVWRQDYQRTIVSTARRLEAEGLIRIIAVERLHFSPTWRNTPTLVVWEPA